jgi:hypothetical protein
MTEKSKNPFTKLAEQPTHFSTRELLDRLCSTQDSLIGRFVLDELQYHKALLKVVEESMVKSNNDPEVLRDVIAGYCTSRESYLYNVTSGAAQEQDMIKVAFGEVNLH